MSSAASPSKESARSLESVYATAVLRVILGAARALQSADDGGVPRRTLITHLRGNRPPPPWASRDGFGLLESHRLDWVEEALDGAIEEGLLEIRQGPRGSSRIALTRGGSEALDGKADPGAARLPTRPLPGAHPKLEKRLEELRRRLAADEGVSAYVVFPNAVLAALASKPPSSLAELAEVRGMGEARVRKYGRRILAALRRDS